LLKPINILNDFKNVLITRTIEDERRDLSSYSNLTIDQLDFREYQIRMEKQYHEPFEVTVKLDKNKRVQTVFPVFKKMRGAIEIINSSVPVNGKLMSKNSKKEFQLNSSQKASFMLPYGDYTLYATAKDYFSFNQKIELYSDQAKPAQILLKAPNKKSARTFSMVIPGVGQLYSFQYGKGGLFLTSTVLGAVWAVNFSTEYTDELNKYNEYVELYQSSQNLSDMNKYRNLFTDSKEMLQTYKRQWSFAVGIMGVSYLANLIDIYFFFPSNRYQQNIGLNYNPEGNSYEISYKF